MTTILMRHMEHRSDVLSKSDAFLVSAQPWAVHSAWQSLPTTKRCGPSILAYQHMVLTLGGNGERRGTAAAHSTHQFVLYVDDTGGRLKLCRSLLNGCQSQAYTDTLVYRPNLAQYNVHVDLRGVTTAGDTVYTVSQVQYSGLVRDTCTARTPWHAVAIGSWQPRPNGVIQMDGNLHEDWRTPPPSQPSTTASDATEPPDGSSSSSSANTLQTPPATARHMSLSWYTSQTRGILTETDIRHLV